MAGLGGPSRLRWRDYQRITRSCKLHDFDGSGWIGYGGRR
jgi:hypothetical protein